MVLTVTGVVKYDRIVLSLLPLIKRSPKHWLAR